MKRKVLSRFTKKSYSEYEEMTHSNQIHQYTRQMGLSIQLLDKSPECQLF